MSVLLFFLSSEVQIFLIIFFETISRPMRGLGKGFKSPRPWNCNYTLTKASKHFHDAILMGALAVAPEETGARLESPPDIRNID
jgi:hypothetical protein